MPEIKNTTRGPLTLSTGHTVPAGGRIFVSADVLDGNANAAPVQGWFNSGALVLMLGDADTDGEAASQGADPSPAAVKGQTPQPGAPDGELAGLDDAEANADAEAAARREQEASVIDDDAAASLDADSPSNSSAALDELKRRAKALGIDFGPRIGAETLAMRIQDAEAG